ncbi:S-adenosyl-L-methionine-dependent methyltransferase [Hyaloraphidium curvatum]|nr:S-adenosyl-L-methionine-dependent methyltransferase [Hyaloraphidium curvatum]
MPAPDDQYNPPLAPLYSRSKGLPFRRATELPTLLSLLPPISGRRVLDLACGDGTWARRFAAMGAQVVGVDLSPAMVARAVEEGGGPTYHVGDARTCGVVEGGGFDAVVASYLLNYARGEEELTAMLRTAFSNLAPGGAFVGFNDGPFDPVESYGAHGRYGFVKRWQPRADNASGERRDGDSVVYRIFSRPLDIREAALAASDPTVPDAALATDVSSFELENYYLSPDTVRACFAAAGFEEFRFVRPVLDQQVSEEEGVDEGFWDGLRGREGEGGGLVGLWARRGR